MRQASRTVHERAFVLYAYVMFNLDKAIDGLPFLPFENFFSRRKVEEIWECGWTFPRSRLEVPAPWTIHL